MKNSFFLIFLFSSVVWADPNQLMGGLGESEGLIDKLYKKVNEEGSWVSGSDAKAKNSIEKDYKKVGNRSPFLSDQNDSTPSKEGRLGENIKSPGQLLLGETDHYPNYLETSYKEIKNRLHNKGRRAYKLGYLFQNKVAYKSENNSYERTFIKSPKNIQTGFLMVGYEGYINRRFVDLFWGLNVGMNFKRGRGAFTSDHSYSEDAYINLWSFPFDVGLGVNIPLSPWFGVAAMAGPSGMFLLQSRSDRGEGERGGTYYQSSAGYFADVQFRFSLSDIWPGGTFKLYSDYDVTKLWLNLEVRQQSYSKFQQKDISVDGLSSGVSFTFECL